MNYNPFVRCVGIGTHVFQNTKTKAYDHRLICILNGFGEIYINDRLYKTEPCQLYFISPGTPYRVCCSENQEIAVINFDTDYTHSHLTEPILSVDSARFNSCDILNGTDAPLMREQMNIHNEDLKLLYQLYDTYFRGDVEPELKNYAITAEFCYLISRALLYEKDGKPTASSFAIYKFIIDNAHMKITVNDIAKHFNYSNSYIEKTLRKNYNMSFKQLIIETRLKKSLWLLENTELSCGEIAARLGFSSGQHFSAAFLKKYKKRPSDYK